MTERFVAQITERLPPWLRGKGGRFLLTALLIVPALAFIGYRSARNWDQIRDYRWTFHPGFAALALAGYVLALLCVLWAWNRLMGRLAGFTNLGENARILCLSNLPKRIPGSIWYMAGRAYLYGQHGVAVSATLTAMALEIALTTVAGLVTYLLTLPLVAGAGTPLRLGIALGLLLLLGIGLQPALFNRALAFLLRKLGSQTQIRIDYRDLGIPLLIYVLAWCVGGATLYATIRAIYPLSWPQLPAVVGTWAASGAIGLLASTFLFGFGVREVALSVLLAALMPQPLAVGVAILFWFLLTIGDLISAGVLALIRRGKIPREPDDPADLPDPP